MARRFMLAYFITEGGFMIPLKIVRNDITDMCVDAIVSTANPGPAFGSGVAVAIYGSNVMPKNLDGWINFANN